MRERVHGAAGGVGGGGVLGGGAPGGGGVRVGHGGAVRAERDPQRDRECDPFQHDGGGAVHGAGEHIAVRWERQLRGGVPELDGGADRGGEWDVARAAVRGGAPDPARCVFRPLVALRFSINWSL